MMIYAGFWKRALAFMIDFFFMWVVTLIFFSTFIFAPLVFLVSLFYFPVFHSSSLRATPGKYIMGLAVCRPDDSQLDFKCALIRYFCEMITSCTFGIGYLMAVFTEKKQTLHDYLADTVVVEGQYSDLNPWQAWMAQLRYLFREKGMEKSSDSSTPTIMPPGNAKQNLEDLFDLYKKGILSEEEYKTKKEEYLRKL